MIEKELLYKNETLLRRAKSIGLRYSRLASFWKFVYKYVPIKKVKEYAANKNRGYVDQGLIWLLRALRLSEWELDVLSKCSTFKKGEP